MTTFVLTCFDRPGALDARLKHRPVHLDYLNAHRELVKLAGALLDEEGRPIGSMLVIEADDAAAVEAFAAGDPFAIADLFERSEIRPWRLSVGALA